MFRRYRVLFIYTAHVVMKYNSVDVNYSETLVASKVLAYKYVLYIFFPPQYTGNCSLDIYLVNISLQVFLQMDWLFYFLESTYRYKCVRLILNRYNNTSKYRNIAIQTGYLTGKINWFLSCCKTTLSLRNPQVSTRFLSGCTRFSGHEE